MGQDIQAGRSCGLGRQGPRVLRVDHAEHRLETAACDAGLGVHPYQVEDRNAGCLAARACRRWYGNQRLQHPRHRLAGADRRVHIVEQVGWIRRVKVRHLGGIYRRPAAYSNERVKLADPGEVYRFLKRFVRRLNPHAVK